MELLVLCLCLHVLDRTHLGVTLYNKNGGGQHYGENASEDITYSTMTVIMVIAAMEEVNK